ncbi:MAG: hypothetical protein Q7Q71_09170 [Verrucomicrobiota bacterium JB023]|nr:hypothetical protein [Verrucomicrobiota bacterium JB023]
MNSTPFVQILLAILACCPLAAQVQGPRITVPSRHAPAPTGNRLYDWHLGVTATIFWVGETPTPRNPTPNNKSSWDTRWQQNYGGFDNPNPAARRGYLPKAFTPKLNPFYIALPYNDVKNHREHKPEAASVIPWFRHYNPRPGQTVCRGRWVQIVRNDKVCYAQWEDCGPFVTDDWEYVFKNKKPKNHKNGGAGIDVSPAVRDFMNLKSGQKVHWRFVEMSQVPPGPWRHLGDNNPFVSIEARRAHTPRR